MMRPRTAGGAGAPSAAGGGGALGLGDLNASLDASMCSVGGLDTTARLEARKSLSSSGVGRASFIKAAPGTATKRPAFGVGRPSMAANNKENGDRCARRRAAPRARARVSTHVP